MSVLRLVVSETCQDLAVTLLSEEVRTLRQRVTELQQIRPREYLREGSSDSQSAAPEMTSASRR